MTGGEAPDTTSSHPVEHALRRAIANPRANTVLERLVLEFGQPFFGASLPNAYQYGPPKSCFENAGRSAFYDCGIYVEGFAISPNLDFALHHAWLTEDGITAIDVTWSNSKQCYYFGVLFSPEVFQDTLHARRNWGLLDAANSVAEMREMLHRNKAALMRPD